MADLTRGLELPKKMTGTSANFTKIAKYFQYPVFFERELKLWEENPEYDDTTLHVFLYHNRLRYLGKTPKELTNQQILNGLWISGVLRQYTKFDTTIMSELLKKYQIKSVYDPCAGWGERMLCCFWNHVSYWGMDINEKLLPGYHAMRNHYDMNYGDYWLDIGDSATGIVPECVDMVFTCPPYHDIEIYTDKGAENLSYPDFLDWWGRVVQNSLRACPDYFVFVINQKYRDDMLQRVLDNGFELLEELSCKTKSSHFTRSKGGNNRKKETETTLVCKRVW